MSQIEEYPAGSYMNAGANLIVAIVLIFYAGVVGKKTLVKLEAMALTRIQKGLPHLSGFTSRLTGLEFDKAGNVIEVRSLRRR